MLNSTQARRLFEKEAGLFNTRDGVPEPSMVRLFGEKIVNVMLRRKNDRLYMTFPATVDRELAVFFYEGFCIAVTLANMNEVTSTEHAPSANRTGRRNGRKSNVIAFPEKKASAVTQ